MVYRMGSVHRVVPGLGSLPWVHPSCTTVLARLPVQRVLRGVRDGGVLGSRGFPGLGSPSSPASLPKVVTLLRGITAGSLGRRKAESGNNQIAAG